MGCHLKSRRHPSNKWVWELQERLENAHAFVRNKMNQSKVRQKHYHDRKLKWKKFEDGKKACVFFPRRIPCASPKRFRSSDQCRSDALKVQASFTG